MEASEPKLVKPTLDIEVTSLMLGGLYIIMIKRC